jgi:hypothetical protein
VALERLELAWAPDAPVEELILLRHPIFLLLPLPQGFLQHRPQHNEGQWGLRNYGYFRYLPTSEQHHQTVKEMGHVLTRCCLISLLQWCSSFPEPAVVFWGLVPHLSRSVRYKLS